jgi:DNA helicase-2/ATP-dependent DNA helicase PcrA
VEDAHIEVFGPGQLEAVAGVDVDQVGLGVEHDRWPGEGEGLVDEPARQSSPPVAGRRDHAPDAVPAVRFGQHSDGGRDAAVCRHQPEVRGAGLEVAPIGVEVGARLLEDEHLRAEQQQRVEVRGADVVTGGLPQLEVVLHGGDGTGVVVPAAYPGAVALPGPPELGRAVIVGAGAPAPSAWAGAERVVIDDAALADPAAVVAALHVTWSERTPIVIELAVDPGRFRAPEAHHDPVWLLGAGFEPWADRLHFLVWSNSYDAQGEDEPIWWWARKAARLGAAEAGEGVAADVLLADGTPAWIDGGPRSPLAVPLGGAAVIHRESVELGSLVPLPTPVASSAELAPDQLEAVAHGSGPARIIAPAGSGKTRVLTERYRHLLADRGYEREAVVALAYNKKAQEEMAARLPGLGARIQTINAWGYGILTRALGRRPELLDEREVRSIVERLVPSKQRRVNTDPIGPYLDGLSLIRLGLRRPQEVEDSLDDVTGLAAAYEPFREELHRRGAIDFDEQVFGALEALMHDGELRRAVQADHRHLLVDELQDLTPAHVLLVRLAAGPAADVFAVGDDDQCIYGHVGADPRFLIEYPRFFPGADEHALEVNYRCPAPVTQAAATLLTYNDVRVAKDIRPGPDVDTDPSALLVQTHAADTGARALVDAVTGWLGEPGVEPEDVAVLARVQSLLLAPHVALAEAGVAVDSVLDESVLARLGVRAALAYVRIAVDPEHLSGADLSEVHRRPSRGLPQWATKWLDKCRSVDDVRRAAARIDDPKVGAKLDDLAGDLDRLARLAARGATARDLLTAVRDDIGLGSAMTLLDSTGGASGSHLDDLEALLQVADLHPDASSFEAWLRRAFHRERAEGGVTLSTIHRVKGREWDRVVVFGATEGLMPHRLTEDIEEERRVLHVGITRGRHRVLVLGDRTRRSPFLSELDGSAERGHLRQIVAPIATSPAARKVPEMRTTLAAEIGQQLKVLGGYEGEVDHLDDDGVRLRLDDGGSFFVRFGERVQLGGTPLTLARPPSPLAASASTALRAWRLERSKADGVPAFVVLSDKHLDGIAERHPSSLTDLRACPGIGPAKLDTYGDEILEVLAAVG